MTGAPEEEPSAVAKLFGALLIALGALIAGLCGLCSLTFVGAMVVTTLRGLQRVSEIGTLLAVLVSTLTAAALFGGVPIGVGVLLILAGRRMSTGARKPRHD